MLPELQRGRELPSPNAIERLRELSNHGVRFQIVEKYTNREGDQGYGNEIDELVETIDHSIKNGRPTPNTLVALTLLATEFPFENLWGIAETSNDRGGEEYLNFHRLCQLYLEGVRFEEVQRFLTQQTGQDHPAAMGRRIDEIADTVAMEYMNQTANSHLIVARTLEVLGVSIHQLRDRADLSLRQRQFELRN